MKTKIDCDKALVKDIFKNWYSIPNYQRPYVWETDQVEELLSCISGAKDNHDEQYFIGSIIYKVTEKVVDGVKYQEFELLDGQQRITTIFLIIAVIRDIVLKNRDQFDEDTFKDITSTCEELIYQRKSRSKGNPERMRIVFDIRKEVKEFVNNYIKPELSTLNDNMLKILASDNKKNTSIKHMVNTILTVRKYFNDNISIPSELEEFFYYLQNNVLMVYIATENLDDAFQLFTVMNNTGLKLTNSDILKATNLKEIESESIQKECAMEWEDMETYFGDDFDNFLSQIRTILVKRRADYTLIKEFSDIIYSGKRWDRSKKQWVNSEPLLNKGKDTFAFVKDYFDVYQLLFDKSHFDEIKSYHIFNYLSFMTKAFETDYWKAPVLMYFKKFGYNGFQDFLKKLDNKLSCDWIIGLVASMRIDNMNQILVCIEKAQNYVEVLTSNVFNINLSDFKSVITDSIYGRRYARYLLLKIDLLNESQSEKYDLPDTISIEHILPQNPNDSSLWVSDFSVSDREEWTDKIGNLVLISRRKNTAQGNRDYAAKKEKYFKNNIERFPSMLKLFNDHSEWKLENLIKRQNEVVEMLLNYYECK